MLLYVEGYLLIQYNNNSYGVQHSTVETHIINHLYIYIENNNGVITLFYSK